MTSKSEPAAPPPCVACKGLPNPAAMLNFDALDLVVSHHALLHAKLAEIAELRALRDRLRDAILYTTELYAEPVRYKTSKGLKPNLSIGFETRYQEMYELAAALAPKGGT